MVAALSPLPLIDLLLPYASEHKNPKVRGKAGGALAASAARLPPAALDLPRLLPVAGKLVTDNTPDARDAAKRLAGQLKGALADPAVAGRLGVAAPEPAGEGEEAPRRVTLWEHYCQVTLPGSAALAVLKATAE